MINISQTPIGGPTNYFIRTGYRSRNHVEYFQDQDTGVIWQPDVYPYATRQAVSYGCDVLLDIGCGRASKLASIATQHPGWTLVGVDFGSNLQWCRKNHQFGTWIEADLETTRRLPVPPELVRRAVIVCSDVVEHLLDPTALLEMVRNLLADGAALAVFSTPARERRSGYAAPGPPRNPSHVREWASDEFNALLTHAGFTIIHADFTRSDDAGGGMTTQLVVVGGAEADGQQ